MDIRSDLALLKLDMDQVDGAISILQGLTQGQAPPRVLYNLGEWKGSREVAETVTSSLAPAHLVCSSVAHQSRRS